jgi:Family of unknown function (DUF5899)
MEIAIPLVALGGMYLVSNQQNKKKNPCSDIKEGFDNALLPNTNIPSRNFDANQNANIYQVQNVENDITTELAVNNKYDGRGTYTDKYFNASAQENKFGSLDQTTTGMICTDTSKIAYESLTGEKVGCDYFRHNNMVPYFGGKVRSRVQESNATESLMDNYTGSGSQTIKKKEQSPLFAPADHLQWAYGAPNQSDFYQSRMNPSMKMSNVKPFEEQMVGPGLGLGYTTEGAGGFNSGMMARDQWMEKSVDDLRVANKPKASGLGALGYEGPANSYIKELGSIGQVEKNRVTKTFELGQDRLLTTTGVEKGQTLRAIPIDRDVSRPETSTSYIGGAGAYVDANYVDGEYMPSKHIDLGSLPLGPASATRYTNANDTDYEAKSLYAYPNNRTANQVSGDNSYFGAVGGAIGAVVSPLLDVLRPSRRQNVVGNLRTYGDAGTKVANSYIMNPADRAPTTIRETTENAKFHLQSNATALQNGGAYAITKHQPIVNARMNQSVQYTGNASAGSNSRQPRNYEAEYRQRNNDIKSSTIDGRMVPGNMALLNNQVNITSQDSASYLTNNRAPAGAMPYGSAPSVDQLGRLQGKQTLYSGAQAERSNGDVLAQLKGNPYALSITR